MIHRGENRGPRNTGTHMETHMRNTPGKPMHRYRIHRDTPTETLAHRHTPSQKRPCTHVSHREDREELTCRCSDIHAHRRPHHTERTREALLHTHIGRHTVTLRLPLCLPLYLPRTETRGARRLRSAATHRTSGAGTGRHRSTGKTGEIPHTGEHTQGNTHNIPTQIRPILQDVQ